MCAWMLDKVLWYREGKMRLYECVWDLVVGYSKKLYISTAAIFHLTFVNNLNLFFLFAF